MKKKRKYFFYTLLVILLIGFLIPQQFQMPVSGADSGSYNKASFWYYPWGKSGTHKGVDIFAAEGTDVFSSTYGWVVYTGEINRGGNVVCVLGPKWRVHYYAHLSKIIVSKASFVKPGELIGKVGTTGNAQGKSPHLHYSIATLVPFPWQIDFDHQGWKKMFYMDPISYLRACK